MRLLFLPSVLAVMAGCAVRTPIPTREATAAPAAERIAWMDVPGGRLRVSDGGAGGPAVVFVHGLGCDLEVWREQLDHVRASRRAIAYDQRGHGASDRAPGGVYTIEALADDLEAVRAALGLDRMVLVGHSMSGAVLTTYAGRHPDRVAGLVYVDAIGDFSAIPASALEAEMAKDAALRTVAQVRAQLDSMLGPLARPATREKVLASVAHLDPLAFSALRAGLFAFRDGKVRAAPYRGPALAVEAAEGGHTSVLAAQVLGIPRTTVAGVSHWLQLDDPVALDRALDGFLAR